MTFYAQDFSHLLPSKQISEIWSKNEKIWVLSHLLGTEVFGRISLHTVCFDIVMCKGRVNTIKNGVNINRLKDEMGKFDSWIFSEMIFDRKWKINEAYIGIEMTEYEIDEDHQSIT